MKRVLDMTGGEFAKRLRDILADNPCEDHGPAMGVNAELTRERRDELMKRGVAILVHRDYLVRMVTLLEGQQA